MKAIKLAGIFMVMTFLTTACGSADLKGAEEETVYVEPNIYTQLEAKEFELCNNPSSMHTDVGVGSIKFSLSSISSYTSLNKDRDEDGQDEDQTVAVEEDDDRTDGIVDVTNRADGDEYE